MQQVWGKRPQPRRSNAHEVAKGALRPHDVAAVAGHQRGHFRCHQSLRGGGVMPPVHGSVQRGAAHSGGRTHAVRSAHWAAGRDAPNTFSHHKHSDA
jgi:hypothetical protein